MKRFSKILACALALVMLLGLGASALAIDDTDDFCGVWECDTAYLWYVISESGAWAKYTADGLENDGYYEYDSDYVYLYMPDGTMIYYLTANGNVMADDEGYTFYPASEIPDLDISELESLGYAGTWECEEAGVWLSLYPSNVWFLYNEDGLSCLGPVRVTDNGTLLLMESLNDDDSEALLEVGMNDDGTLIDAAGEVLVPGSLPFEHGSIMDANAGSSTSGGINGVWENDEDGSTWLALDEDDWALYMEAGMVMSGYTETDGETVVLYYPGGMEYDSLTLSGDALVEDETDAVFTASSLPDEFEISGAAALGIDGLWEYPDGVTEFLVYESGMAMVLSSGEAQGMVYFFVADDGTIYMVPANDPDLSNPLMVMTLRDDDTLVTTNGLLLSRVS